MTIVYCLEHLRPYGQQAGNETVRLQESTHEGKRQNGSSFKIRYATLFPLFFMFAHDTDKSRHITLFLRPEGGLMWAGSLYVVD
jgi:hypothetical protein